MEWDMLGFIKELEANINKKRFYKKINKQSIWSIEEKQRKSCKNTI